MFVAEPILVDVDVALKACIYRSEVAFIASTTLGQPPALLAISRFTLRSRLRAARNLVDPESTAEAIDNLIANTTLIEPTEEEIEMAADFEEEAIQHSLELDTGESQLLAILLRRDSPLLLTGDKRAIQAIHNLGIRGIDRRLACLEQLVATILVRCGCQKLRERVCGEPRADSAVTYCFACSASNVTEKDIRAGLASYVNYLRKSTAALLIASHDLSAVVP